MAIHTARSATTYDPTTIVLHWLTAVLVSALWLVGQTADFIPDGPLNTAVWSCHVVFGFVLAALLVFRVYHRLTNGRRLPPTRAFNKFAVATHLLLYALLGVVVILGVANAFVRGYNLFDVVSLPQIGDKDLKKPITEWHGLLANVTLALAGLHAVAALVHHYAFGDAVLARMIPVTRRRQSASYYKVP